MKKLICLFCAFCSVFALAACGDQGGDQQGEQEMVTQKYVSRFDCYEDMVICSLDYYYWSDSGAAEFELNTEKEYISEGDGSMKVHVLTPSRFLTSIEANNFRADNTKISGAKTISIDVYNPTESPVEYQRSVNGYSRTVLGVSKTCAAGAWTTVSGNFEEDVTETLKSFTLEVSSSAENPYDLYFDNFYLDFGSNSVK